MYVEPAMNFDGMGALELLGGGLFAVGTIAFFLWVAYLWLAK